MVWYVASAGSPRRAINHALNCRRLVGLGAFGTSSVLRVCSRIDGGKAEQRESCLARISRGEPPRRTLCHPEWEHNAASALRGVAGLGLVIDPPECQAPRGIDFPRMQPAVRALAVNLHAAAGQNVLLLAHRHPTVLLRLQAP